MEQVYSNNGGIDHYRAKLYLLNGDNGWIDQGTGFPIIAEEVRFSAKIF